MKAKLDNFSELSKHLSDKSVIAGDLMTLFGRFGLGRLLSRLSLEKQCGVSSLELIISLCLFRINGESIHSIYTKRFHDLLQTGKNCYYRMLNRSTMDWRKLHLGMSLRFLSILRKEHAEESHQPRCYIFDDTTLKKTGFQLEGVSRVFDHVKGGCVLGYKLLLMAFFDGRSTIPIDFSLHREKGKKGDGGLTKKQLSSQYTKKRKSEDPNSNRFLERDSSKIDCAISMMKRAWNAGIRAKYVLTDSWFTCEALLEAVRKLGQGAIHFVGLAKMGNTKYEVRGRKENALALVSLYERKETKTCRKYKCRYIRLTGYLGKQPVRIYLVRYKRNENWNILLTTDLSLDFVRCFELYQIRWNIEVLIKESKGLMGLGDYQGRDFDGQIADCTLCFLTCIVASLDKRFSDYETMGELFASHRDELMALTLWKRILAYIAEMLETLSYVIGLTPETFLTMIIEDERMMEKYKIVIDALKDYNDQEKRTA